MRLLTHLYAANLLIKEIEEKEGKLEIAAAEGEYQIGTLKEPEPKGEKGTTAPKKDAKSKGSEEKGDTENDPPKSNTENGDSDNDPPENDAPKENIPEEAAPPKEAPEDTSPKNTPEADASGDGTVSEGALKSDTLEKNISEKGAEEKDTDENHAPEEKGRFCGGKKCEELNPLLVFPFKGGTFQMPERIRDVILNNKEYFRAGAAGMDVFPDMLFSRLVIHPTDSGIWLEHMYEKMLTLPPGKESDQAYAFVLGAMTHYSTDMFGNSYINEYAGGWSAGPVGKNEIAQRHAAVEAYIDSKLTEKIIPESERIMRAPIDFIVYCFADADGIKKRIGKISGRTYTPPGGFRRGEPLPEDAAQKRSEECLAAYEGDHMMIYQLSRLRETICGLVQYDPENETPAMRSIQEAGKAGELSLWLEDMDVVIKNWVIAWQLSLQGLTEGKSESHITDCMDRWIKNSCPGQVLYIPQWLQNAAESDPENLDLSWFLEVPLLKSPPASGKDLLKAISPKDHEGFEKIYAEYSKLSDEKVKALFKGKYKDAEAFYKRLDNDLKEFGKEKEYPYGKKGEFRAFSLSLSASKLCLIGSENLNTFTGQKKKKFKNSSPKRTVRKIKVRIESGEDEGYRQIHLDIVKKDSKAVRAVIGSKFAAVSEFDIILQKPIKDDDIVRFLMSKTGTDVWEIDSVSIKDAETGKQLGSGSGVVIGERFADAVIERPFIAPADAKEDKPGEIEAPHAIMSWIYSLDGADPTKMNPVVNMPWEYEEYLIFHSVKGGSDEWAKYFDLGEMVEINYTPPQIKEKKRIFPVKDIQGTEEKVKNAADSSKEMAGTMEKGNKVG